MKPFASLASPAARMMGATLWAPIAVFVAWHASGKTLSVRSIVRTLRDALELVPVRDGGPQ
jgi:hypothetical protein